MFTRCSARVPIGTSPGAGAAAAPTATHESMETSLGQACAPPSSQVVDIDESQSPMFTPAGIGVRLPAGSEQHGAPTHVGFAMIAVSRMSGTAMRLSAVAMTAPAAAISDGIFPLSLAKVTPCRAGLPACPQGFPTALDDDDEEEDEAPEEYCADE